MPRRVLPRRTDQVATGTGHARPTMRWKPALNAWADTPSRVQTHVSHLLTELDARDRAQLVMLAHRAGLAG
jgi:hypothetical protein